MLGMVARAMRRGAKRYRAAGTELDIPERIALAAQDVVPGRRLADVLATELSILYYAIAAWRRRPFVPSGTIAFTYHRENAFAAILATVLLAAVGELVAVHFLVRNWSASAAWVLTIVSAIGAFWLLGFLRSILLRPILIDAEALRVRVGVQWRAEIPFEAIERAEFGRVPAPARGAPGVLRAVRIGQPNALLALKRPVTALGPYGIRREVSLVALSVDRRRDFEQELRTRVAAIR